MNLNFFQYAGIQEFERRGLLFIFYKKELKPIPGKIVNIYSYIHVAA
jgi:hypothetical protein